MSKVPVQALSPWLPPFAEEEYAAVSDTLCRRIQDGTMPPDDAYWWTRVQYADAVCAMLRDVSRPDRLVPAARAVLPDGRAA